MKSLTPRLAHALVALHPPAWRRRYASEVGALVDAAPVTMGSLVDLARSMVSEWRLAWWRSGTRRSTGWPSVGQAANLVLITMATFVAIKFALAVAEATVLTGLFFAMKGEVVAKFFVPLLGRGPGPGTTIAPFGFFLLWWFGPAVAAATLLRLTPASRLSPLICRALTACAFASIALWLFDWQMQVASLAAGWVLAAALFPRRSVDPTSGLGQSRREALGAVGRPDEVDRRREDVRPSQDERGVKDAWLASRLRRRGLDAVTA